MRILGLIILLAASLTSRAQYYWDFGGGLGMANYLGEIGGDEKTRRDFIADMKLSQTRWAINGFGRYKFNSLLSFKGGLTYARIQGSDALSSNRGRNGRNLSFRNDMVETSFTTEVNFYRINDVGRTGRYRVDARYYGFFGIAALLHSPRAKYQGEWVPLRPLQTEGVAYNKIVPTVPVGVGLYYTYRRKYRIGWELGYRFTFTDYLDDVSTVYVDHDSPLANRRGEVTIPAPDPAHYRPGEKRGDPTHNDGYFFTTVNFSYVLRGKGSFYRKRFEFTLGSKRKKRTSRAKF